jgi:predicted SPOUT superfamily RNA methylase MTH1
VLRFREVSSQSNGFHSSSLGDILRQFYSAQSHDQKTYLAGTIARALAVFCVDEVVIFEDGQKTSSKSTQHRGTAEETYTAASDPCHFLSHVLSYLETPPYLRKALFPMHPNLRTAGTLPSLDMPHHSRVIEHCDYREGVTVEATHGSTQSGTLVDVGLPTKRILRDVHIAPNTRVTLKLEGQSDNAEAVAPTTPREEAGYYWGYNVRRCNSLSAPRSVGKISHKHQNSNLHRPLNLTSSSYSAVWPDSKQQPRLTTSFKPKASTRAT